MKAFKKAANDGFLQYFKKYEKNKNKWVFCFLEGENTIRTNMHIESWHKTLKYSYLSGKKNKRADKLITKLLEMSNDVDYNMTIGKEKPALTTFNRKTSSRHQCAQSVLMKLISENCIQVIYFNIS